MTAFGVARARIRTQRVAASTVEVALEDEGVVVAGLEGSEEEFEGLRVAVRGVGGVVLRGAREWVVDELFGCAEDFELDFFALLD